MAGKNVIFGSKKPKSDRLLGKEWDGCSQKRQRQVGSLIRFQENDVLGHRFVVSFCDEPLYQIGT